MMLMCTSRWRLSGRPTFGIVVTENNMRDPQFPSMLTALAEFRTGMVNGVKVNVGRVQGKKHRQNTRANVSIESESCININLCQVPGIWQKCFTTVNSDLLSQTQPLRVTVIPSRILIS